MTPHWSSSIRKITLQALLGLSIVAASNASLAATALIKVNISLPQVLTTSLSQDSMANPASFESQDIQQHFNDSKNNGHLVRSEAPRATNSPVTYLYIQT